MSNLDDQQISSPVPSTSAYVYKPLDPERSQFRVVSLLPSHDFSVALEVIIRPTSFSETKEQKYEALSFLCMGFTRTCQDDKCSEILAKAIAEDTAGTFWLYRNITYFTCHAKLDEALRHLRLEDRERLLWIDAICINQSDGEEKTYQVGIMSET